MKYKKIIFTYFISIAILFLLFFGTLFIQDPLKIFHKPWKHKNYLQSSMREQAAGIINHWDFDSILLGTSMLENTSSTEASKLLGGTFVNISLAGSTFAERKIVLDYTLRTKKIKTVIFTLDELGALIKEKPKKEKKSKEKSYSISNWDYLYDNNPLNDFQAYINDRYLKCIFLFQETKECIGQKVNLDRPNAWYQNIFHFYRFGGLEHWFKVKKNWQVIGTSKLILKGIKAIKAGRIYYDKNASKKIINSKKYIHDTLETAVLQYPDTEFIFIVPPYSRLEYAIWAQYEKSTFEIYKATLTYMVTLAQKHKNMKVYAWGTEAFLDDLANYQDLSHYEYKINSWELKAIKENKGLLTLDNIDEYLHIITQKALHYDVLRYEKQFEDFLAP